MAHNLLASDPQLLAPGELISIASSTAAADGMVVSVVMIIWGR
jgi:hypothetical protein